jgi:hypothetical protein
MGFSQDKNKLKMLKSVARYFDLSRFAVAFGFMDV